MGARRQKQLVRGHVSKGRKAGLPSRARPDDDEQVKSCTAALHAAVET